MRTKLTFAFTAAALAGGLLSSCYVAQPSFECFPSASHYTGDMKLLSPEVAVSVRSKSSYHSMGSSGFIPPCIRT